MLSPGLLRLKGLQQRNIWQSSAGLPLGAGLVADLQQLGQCRVLGISQFFVGFRWIFPEIPALYPGKVPPNPREYSTLSVDIANHY